MLGYNNSNHVRFPQTENIFHGEAIKHVIPKCSPKCWSPSRAVLNYHHNHYHQSLFIHHHILKKNAVMVTYNRSTEQIENKLLNLKNNKQS